MASVRSCFLHVWQRQLLAAPKTKVMLVKGGAIRISGNTSMKTYLRRKNKDIAQM